MKLPKDLQKKKTISERRISTNEMIKLKNAFKDEFRCLQHKFNNKREIVYPSKNDLVYHKTSIKSTVSVIWTKEKIEISFYNKNINALFFSIKERVININFSMFFKQIAHHEYGHILSAETTYDLYPDEARKYDIFKISSEDLLAMNYSELEYSLKKVSINRLMGVFWEFLADYLVSNKIDKTPPLEMLKEKEANIMYIIENIKGGKLITLNFPKSITSKYDRGYDRIFLILRLSITFYIFNKWNQFISFFAGMNLSNLLKFLKVLNILFRKIVNKGQDLISMKKNIIKLAIQLDNINYEGLVLKNMFLNDEIQILRDFEEKILKNK